MDSILPILKKIPVFAELSEEQHKEIIRNITLNYFPAGYVFFHEGDFADSMFLIKTGMVRITRKNKDEEKELDVLTNNDFFGEMALISDKPRNATATSISECEIFILKKTDFLNLIQLSPALANGVSNKYIERVKTVKIPDTEI